MIGGATKIFIIAAYLILSDANFAVSSTADGAIATSEQQILNPVIAKTSEVRAKKSLPSLWWATEQFDPFGGRLIESWTSHTHLKEINLVVNLQLWTLLDYLGRYSFVNQFGTTARKYGYNLSIFSTKKQRLATYRYNSKTNPPKWEITLERLGGDSLRVAPNSD